MDGVTEAIARYAVQARFEDLPEDVVRQAELRVFDAVGCALGAVGSPPHRMASRWALPVAAGLDVPGPGVGIAGVRGGRLIGRPDIRTTPDAAAFVNITMIRYLDFNDWSPNGHPSDIIGALLAVADEEGVTGRRLVAATVVAYEVFIGLTEASRLPSLGWDQGFALGIATAAGLGQLLELGYPEVANAVGILAAAGLPTGASRSGELSMWKGCATAFAARNAVFVTLLARDGMSGPGEAFEGRRGIWSLVTGPFELELDPSDARPYRLMRTALKSWPACFHGQAAIEAAAQLADDLDLAQLESLEVATYVEAWRSTGSEPQKWDPRSRETADHSMAYLVARALVDNGVRLSAFEPDAYLDPELRPLMRRITVVADDAATAAYPDAIVARVTARTTAGQTRQVEVVDPPGHPGRPMAEAQVREKFRGLATVGLGAPEPAAAALAHWREVTALDDLRPALDVLVARSPGRAGLAGGAGR